MTTTRKSKSIDVNSLLRAKFTRDDVISLVINDVASDITKALKRTEEQMRVMETKKLTFAEVKHLVSGWTFEIMFCRTGKSTTGYVDIGAGQGPIPKTDPLYKKHVQEYYRLEKYADRLRKLRDRGKTELRAEILKQLLKSQGITTIKGVESLRKAVTAKLGLDAVSPARKRGKKDS